MKSKRGAHRRPTVEQLKKLFSVAEDGSLIRKVSCGPNGEAGRVAGWPAKNGYICLEVLGCPTTAHRVVFAIVNGKWPSDQVDHIDGNRSNNRPSNLREAWPALNQQNLKRARAHNKIGLLGVTKGKRGKFRAAIVIKGKQIHIGEFLTAQEAHAAYLEQKRKHHEGSTL